MSIIYQNIKSVADSQNISIRKIEQETGIKGGGMMERLTKRNEYGKMISYLRSKQDDLRCLGILLTFETGIRVS